MALKLKGSTSGFVGLDAPAVAGNNTLILPDSAGSAGQILANDITAGVTTFTSVTVSRNGDLTVPGTISIGGTLTYEDVTNVDSVGVITARTNIILGDSLKHLGDENTLISFPANDTITAETSGTEALRIDSSGNVNLGASADNTAIQASGPFSGATPKLEIKLGGASNSYTRLINIANPSGATGSETLGRVGIKLALGSETNGTETAKAGIIYAESTSTYNNAVSLCLATNNTERMRISSDGKIGMGGATAPEEVLDLGNAVQINLKVGGRAYLGQGYSTAATILGHSVKAKTTGTVSGGMEVTETNSGGGAPVAVRMVSGTFQVHTATSGTSGATFDNEKLRINASGKVNIGGDYTQTTRQLGVVSSAEQVASFEYNGADADGSEVRFYHNSSSPADNDNLAYLQFSGKNSADEVTMYSAIIAQSSDVTNGTEDGNIIFSTRNNGSFGERVRVDSSGNVLIGTTTEEDTTGNSGPKIIHTGDIQIDGDQKVLLFRSTNSTAQKQSGIQWWNENGAGVQCAIFGIRETVTYAKSALGFYTSENVDTSANNSEGDITERMRITSGGIVNISHNGNDLNQTTYRFQLTGSGGGEAASMAIKNEGSHPAKLHLMSGHGNWSVGNSVTIGDALEFRDESASATSMYLDSSGNAIFNGRVGINFANPGARFVVSQNANQLEPMRIRDANNTNSVTHYISFRKADSEKGSIKGDRGGTSFNTTSDYRLKQNVTSISDGITRIKQLLPKKFSFIEDETNTLRDGFLAHEVSSLVPEAVDGTKDAVDSDNKPIHQQIDHSKLVPLLTAALQEEIAKRESLEARVAALEG